MSQSYGRQIRARRAERGAGTLEYVAAFALAALVITAALAGLQQGRLDGIVQQAICKVTSAIDGGSCTGTGPGSPTQPQPPFDPKPKKCKINTHSQQVNSEIKILFIKIGENAGFVETTYSDGTVTYTATDGAGLGAEGGVGATFDIGKVEAGAKVDFGGGLEFAYGSTWTFKNADEANAMKDQLNTYLAQQETLKHNPEASLGYLITGMEDPPKPPNQTVTSFEVKGNVTGSIGISLPWDDSGSSSSSGSSGSDDSKVPNLKLAKAGLTIGGGGKWTQISNNETGATTWTTNYDGYAQADGTLGPLSGQIKGLAGSTLSITRDKDGKLTNVTLTSTTSGSVSGSINAGQSDLGGQGSEGGGKGDVHVTTTSLDLTTDDQRSMIETWLKQGAVVTPEMIAPTTASPDDDIQKLFYQQGQVSQVDYDQVTDTEGFAAEVKLGVQLGVNFSYTDEKTQAVNASYLGAPDASGVRSPVPFPECLG